MARNRASPGQQLPGVERAVRTLTCAATARSAVGRAFARARTDRRACTTVRGPTDGNRMARAFPPDLARVGELRRPEVPVRDARAVRVGGLAMNDAKSTVCEHGSLRRQCRVCELESELAEAKAITHIHDACSECFQNLRQERDAALAEVERWKDDYDEEAR